MTTRLFVADNGEVSVSSWPANETGPCRQCHVAARIYGPQGDPLCADCQEMTPAKTVEPPRLIVPIPRSPEPDREPEMTLF